MVRSALVFREECCASYLFNSMNCRLSSNLCSADVIGGSCVPSIACGRVVDLANLFVEALDSFSFLTASTFLFKLLLVELLVKLEYLLLDATVSSSLIALILFVFFHLRQGEVFGSHFFNSLSFQLGCISLELQGSFFSWLLNFNSRTLLNRGDSSSMVIISLILSAHILFILLLVVVLS